MTQVPSIASGDLPAFAPETEPDGPGRCAFQGPVRQVHDLKCWPPCWEAIATGRKTCDLRKNDRGYRVGDLLILREWIPDNWLEDDTPGGFTGRVCQREITHVLLGSKFGLASGYVALSLQAVIE